MLTSTQDTEPTVSDEMWGILMVSLFSAGDERMQQRGVVVMLKVIVRQV